VIAARLPAKTVAKRSFWICTACTLKTALMGTMAMSSTQAIVITQKIMKMNLMSFIIIIPHLIWVEASINMGNFPLVVEEVNIRPMNNYWNWTRIMSKKG